MQSVSGLFEVLEGRSWDVRKALLAPLKASFRCGPRFFFVLYKLVTDSFFSVSTLLDIGAFFLLCEKTGSM